MTIFDGDVYLAQSDTGHYKIGISKYPDKRIKHFDTIMPVDVKMVHSFPSDNCREAESYLHARFSQYNYKGEWFDLPSYAILSICKVTTYFEGDWHIKMNETERTLFELERNNDIAWTYAELPY